MTDPSPDRPSGTSVAARISNHVVQTMSAFTGRGPTRAWTSIDGDLISVVLRDTLTRGERSLLDDGRIPLVLETRQAYQHAMRLVLIEGVQQISGRTVVAFLSANHIDPDIAVESFVLETQEPPVNSSAAQSAE
jgi:uncharacterized protein YbcI